MQYINIRLVFLFNQNQEMHVLTDNIIVTSMSQNENTSI